MGRVPRQPPPTRAGGRERAVELWERLGDGSALGRALATLALQQWTNLRPDDAFASASRAVDLLRPAGDSAALEFALVYLGVVLVNIDRERESVAALDEALAMAQRLGTDRLRTQTLIYRGRALWQLGDPSGPDELRRALAQAVAAGDDERVNVGHLNHVGLLWRSAATTRWSPCWKPARPRHQPRVPDLRAGVRRLPPPPGRVARRLGRR